MSDIYLKRLEGTAQSCYAFNVANGHEKLFCTSEEQFLPGGDSGHEEHPKRVYESVGLGPSFWRPLLGSLLKL